MKILFYSFFCSLFFSTSVFCQKKAVTFSADQILNRSIEAIGKPKQIETIQNLLTFASCLSPQGAYTTEVHTSRNEYGYFKQIYSYRSEPFEGITKSKDQGFYFAKDSLKTLPRTAVYALRSHYFHQLLVDPKKYFHAFASPQEGIWEGKKVYQIEALDELEHPCLLIFEAKKGFLVAFQIQNPDNVQEWLKISFSDWKRTAGFRFPQKLKILQSEKIFSFHFTQIIVNSPDFQEKLIQK